MRQLRRDFRAETLPEKPLYMYFSEFNFFLVFIKNAFGNPKLSVLINFLIWYLMEEVGDLVNGYIILLSLEPYYINTMSVQIVICLYLAKL